TPAPPTAGWGAAPGRQRAPPAPAKGPWQPSSRAPPLRSGAPRPIHHPTGAILGQTRQPMARAWMIATLLLAGCGPPIVDPIATDRTPPGSFTFPYVDPRVPGAPTAFGGATGAAAGAPRLVYPLDGAVHPSNIGQITLQWSRGAPTSRVFRVTLARADGTRYELYAPCDTAACAFAPPP